MHLIIVAVILMLSAHSGVVEETDDSPKMYENFALRDFDGVRYELKDLIAANKATIITFWASWCLPCQKELKEMNKLYTQYRKKQFAVLAVNTDQRQDVIKAKRFLLKNSITFPSVYDERGDVKTKYQITSIPRLFLFDQKGKLIFEAKGFKDISEIENEIKKLIE